jgi:hypothetical protein
MSGTRDPSASSARSVVSPMHELRPDVMADDRRETRGLFVIRFDGQMIGIEKTRSAT